MHFIQCDTRKILQHFTQILTPLLGTDTSYGIRDWKTSSTLFYWSTYCIDCCIVIFLFICMSM